MKMLCDTEWGLNQNKRIEKLERQLEAAQARIDELMLEFCPREMTTEQLNNWAKHQVAMMKDK